MAGVCGVLGDAAFLPQALLRVAGLEGLEHGPSDVLDRLHHLLEGLAVGD